VFAFLVLGSLESGWLKHGIDTQLAVKHQEHDDLSAALAPLLKA